MKWGMEHLPGCGRDTVHCVPGCPVAINNELEALKKEREGVFYLVRELCEQFGDNEWPDDLHLPDAIEKHLAKYLWMTTNATA